ncbi:hypothetical protein BU25DRAFT_259807 [Macroventuria anomochaeta]|uniref:Uncharacterized protein n=1 Tax=Macroventuria anomochaeta TaxID=301207 RepID=A0ACB6RI71_9PLEO|nr:uncharacterized protein BU25DRAFT_259807 [Macroventuria anomochaeta]KAF2621057.1 hypothetical protein BU25DRAFT_259807 [Macroventuria anomochaeta]
MARVVLLGTCDTKLDELLFLRDVIREANVEVMLIDVGRSVMNHESITVSQADLLRRYGGGKNVTEEERGDVIKTMADCATKAVKSLHDESFIQGIIAAGGSGGTSIAATVMRDALPVGFPKLIVSTIASGDTGPIVGETDISLMYSVVDVAGLNEVLRSVLSNAGTAIAGMALGQSRRSRQTNSSTKKRVGITMFGVTTPAVDEIRKHLESKYDVETFVFHATGHGGKAMERLINEGRIDAVLDLTTTEICDHVTGGVMSAGPQRLEAAAAAGIPNIISLGATDMTNFGPLNTVPERYKDRKLYEHNPVVTLMRTSQEEATEVGEFIVSKLKNHTKDPNAVQVWLPKGGTSMIATPDGPFADQEADAKLFHTIKDGLADSGIEVVEDDRAVNDAGFARDIAEALAAKLMPSPKSDG